MMKSLIIISSFMLFMMSCRSSDELESVPIDEILLNASVDEVMLTVANKSFMVDFKFGGVCNNYMGLDILPNVFADLKTTNDLLNCYKNLKPGFLPGYSSMQDNREFLYVKLEYLLAQVCFSDFCDSKTRKEILKLVTNSQKNKFGDIICPSCAQKSGVFLMAVILAKEGGYPRFIDSTTLQQALLFLSNEDFVSEDFNKKIIKCSEKFLSKKK